MIPHKYFTVKSCGAKPYTNWLGLFKYKLPEISLIYYIPPLLHLL